MRANACLFSFCALLLVLCVSGWCAAFRPSVSCLGQGGPVFSALTGSHDTDLPPAVISFKAEQLFVPAPPLLLQEQPFFFPAELPFAGIVLRVSSGPDSFRHHSPSALLILPAVPVFCLKINGSGVNLFQE